MKEYRYVTLDPTGNLTCLVLDRVSPAEETAVTRELLKQCEQVAYLEPPVHPGAVAGIRLMGGEFCGNAAMAAAAWLLRDELEQDEAKTLLLEVSGAADPVPCTVRRTPDGYEGTVEIPGVPEIRTETFCGISFAAVRMEGIIHLICEGRTFETEEAETLLRQAAGQLPDEAAGLLQWDRKKQQMVPLVFVRGSGSMVWEHGCGSGSAAIGVLEALRSGEETATVSVRQPGGTIRVTVSVKNGEVCHASISGLVRLGKETAVEIS